MTLHCFVDLCTKSRAKKGPFLVYEYKYVLLTLNTVVGFDVLNRTVHLYAVMYGIQLY